ncbi:MAG TPA: M23 family metallopeptidase [Longimicrobium sp.]|nr:M23 family metallopeptidase [Longimicrobium sp.]
MTINAVVRVLALAGLLLCTDRSHAQAPAFHGFDMMVPVAPAPVRVGDASQLAYELHLTNFARDSLTLTRVQVLSDADGSTLAVFEGSALEGLVGLAGRLSAGANLRVVDAGGRSILYFNLADEAAVRARRLRHRIDYEVVVNGAREPRWVEGGATTVDRAALPVLGPPLRGGPWAGIYAPEMERGHRRVLYAVDGRARIPGRFAIDWFGVDAQGRFTRSGSDTLTDYIGYGAEVLAVADGVVVAARDDVAEPATTANPPRVSLADATGNYVALDIGGGRFAFYEHLRPGLRVRAGDRVRKGEVIGAVGFTGSASMPHLHFHVSDANAPLAAEGHPYQLTGFRTVGAYPSIDAFGRGEAWRPVTASAGSVPALPSPNTVVEFTP